MRVAVEGELYAGVSGEVLDELGVHASTQKQSEARVPEIMPANIGQSCSLEQGLEMAVDDVLRVERCPLEVAKTSPESLYEPPAPSFSSSWRLRWRLSAAIALCGRSTVRLEAFLGSEKTSLPGLPSSLCLRILCS